MAATPARTIRRFGPDKRSIDGLIYSSNALIAAVAGGAGQQLISRTVPY